MEKVKLCFTCPSKFCELQPGELGSNTIFLQNLIGQALSNFHVLAVVDTIELDCCFSESTYAVHIYLQYDTHIAAIPYDQEALKLEVESVVSQAMLQCFWEIHCSEC